MNNLTRVSNMKKLLFGYVFLVFLFISTELFVLFTTHNTL